MKSSGVDGGKGAARVLLVEDDPDVRAAFEALLRRDGHHVLAAQDGETARTALDSEHFDVIVSDIRLPGLSGVDLLRKVREVDMDVPVILVTGWPQIETATEAVELGALQYLRKPVKPKTLLEAVSRAARLHDLARAQRAALALVGSGVVTAGDRAGLGALLDRSLSDMTMALQPIVRASNPSRIFAFEALLRGGDPALHAPEEVLQAAADLGRLAELGKRTRELSSAAIERLPDDALLFINLSARDLLRQGLSSAEAPLTPHAGRVVLEVTEREAVAETRELAGRLETLRGLGYRLALDDLGAGYASLNSFATLEPEFVKLDRLLIENCHQSEIQQRVVRSLARVCKDLGIQVVAEGIELEEEREAAVELGCDFLQGFLFGRPEVV